MLINFIYCAFKSQLIYIKNESFQSKVKGLIHIDRFVYFIVPNNYLYNEIE